MGLHALVDTDMFAEGARQAPACALSPVFCSLSLSGRKSVEDGFLNKNVE